MNIAFIAITEAGNLENQSALLFRSIRKYGGRFKDSSIHSFQPRKGAAIKPETSKLFDELEVEHHTTVLNKDFEEYPRTNKVFVCAWAEENLSEDVLVFLDSDTLFVQEPSELDLPDSIDVAIRPVDTKNIASSGENDPRESYWQLLYEACKVPLPPFIYTAVDQQRIRAYWNSGLVCVRRKSGLWQQWKQDFLEIMKKGIFPPVKRNPTIGLPFLDQTALAVTLTRVSHNIHVLPSTYNYCLPKRAVMPECCKNIDLEALVHVHYHKWFNRPNFLSAIRPSLNKESEIYIWLSSLLPFYPTIDDPLRF